jgi:hypothetical protein
MKGRSKGASRQDPLLDEKVSSLPMPIKGRIVPRVETHYLDNAQASYNADTTGTVTALNLIAEGNDNVNRLGRKAMMRSVSVKGFVVSPSNAPPAQQTRVLLVWDNAAKCCTIYNFIRQGLLAWILEHGSHVVLCFRDHQSC